MTGSIVLSRLRRDVMILAVADGESAKAVAEAAVREGRAAEAWVLSFSDYFSESAIAWGNVDTHTVSAVDKPQSVAPLNPGVGEQESLDEPKDVDLTSPREEQKRAADAQAKAIDIPDTGTNSQGEPTGEKHFNETNKDVLIAAQADKKDVKAK